MFKSEVESQENQQFFQKCPRNILFAMVSMKTGKTGKIFENRGGKSGKLSFAICQEIFYVSDQVADQCFIEF